jgi:23S rRNA (cytosine1962-C5)-methyltransferase
MIDKTRPNAGLPIVALKTGGEKRLQLGHPWIYSNEIEMTAPEKALAPGSLVTVVKHGNQPVGLFLFNPNSLIAARLLTRDPNAEVNLRFFEKRLGRALTLRNRLVAAPYYRWAHAEADGLPGCVVDRFGDVVVIHATSAGMERLAEPLTAAIDKLIQPKTILLRGEGPARQMEGVEPFSRTVKGELDGPVEILENGVRFYSDPREGQKTGWFFDQRDNRALVAGFARDQTVLDLYSYMGGFGVQAAVAGAREVTLVDRSESALAMAMKSAALNHVAERVATERGEAFAVLEKLGESKRRFGIVVADPPAFVKSKKDFHQGGKAYRKLARLCAQAVEPGGLMFIASCSYNMPAEDFAQQVSRGVQEAGRTSRQLYARGAAPDHPVHPFLPESAYLKALLLQVD